MSEPIRRGDIWFADPNPTRGHEQAGRRPCLVVSVDPFNDGPAGLVIIIPLTTTHRGIPLHVRIGPPEGGLDKTSFVLCEQIRTFSKQRLISRFGTVSRETMRQVEERIQYLVGL